MHPGLSGREVRVNKGDVDILQAEGLLLVTHYGRWGFSFVVTPQGSSFYEEMQHRSGAPTQQVEEELKRYLESQTKQVADILASATSRYIVAAWKEMNGHPDADAALDRETLAVDSSVAAAMESAVAGELLRSVGEGAGAQDSITALARRLPRVAQPGDPTGRFALEGEGDPKAAEDWLLRSLIKDTEGFMSRHVERRVSLALTRRLVTTRITPNAMTLVSLAMGLCGAPFFLSMDPLLQVAGSLLFLTHSILDGCDGELARLKFLESPTGARLDFWGDNLVHVAVFACMAIGWSRDADAAWPLLLGALAVTGTAASAFLVSRQGAGAPTASGARLAEAVANRDFIYLVVLLACFGKAHWFLILVALGTPIFMMLVRWGAGRRRAA